MIKTNLNEVTLEELADFFMADPSEIDKQAIVNAMTGTPAEKICLDYVNSKNSNAKKAAAKIKLNPKEWYVVKYNGQYAYNYMVREPENADKWVLHDDCTEDAVLPGRVVIAAIKAGYDVEVVEVYDAFKWVK